MRSLYTINFQMRLDRGQEPSETEACCSSHLCLASVAAQGEALRVQPLITDQARNMPPRSMNIGIATDDSLYGLRHGLVAGQL